MYIYIYIYIYIYEDSEDGDEKANEEGGHEDRPSPELRATRPGVVYHLFKHNKPKLRHITHNIHK